MTPGQVLNIEHKFTSLDIGAGGPYWKKLTLDGQVSNYYAGARSLGHDIVGTLYDVIARPSLKPYKATPLEGRKYTEAKSKACPECKKKGGDVTAPHTVDGVTCAEARLVTDPGGRLYANMRAEDETVDEYRARLRADIGSNPDAYYQRSTVVRLENELNEAAYSVWSTARSLREAEIANRWPQHDNACESYGRMCEYFDVCTNVVSIEDAARFRDADEHEELEAPVGDGKKRLPVVTTSSLKTFRACPRRYFFSYVRKRRSVERGEALNFGTLGHLGLEAWWRTGDLTAAYAAMAGEADPFELVKVQELLLGYHVRWSEEPLEVLAVEAQFEAPLVNPVTGAPSKTYRLSGKVDAIARVTEAA